MKINQSFIKRISGQYCPKKVKLELDGKHKRPASEAMIKGQYFEYILFGTKNREGQIPEIPLLKNGNKSTDQIRIEAQKDRFFEVCRANDIKFFGTDRTFHVDLFGVETFGTWDGYGTYKKRPVVIDIKLPGNVDNDFGDFCWGDFEKMDKLQADQYMLAGRKLDGIPYDFLYMIFDYKKNPGFKLIFVPYTPNTPLHVQSRISETVMKVESHEREGWPAMGYEKECKTCPLADTCSNFISKEMIKSKWAKIELSKLEKEMAQRESEDEFNKIVNSVMDSSFTF
jgi:hypothetical protein